MRKKIPIATTSSSTTFIRLRAKVYMRRMRGKKLPDARALGEAGKRRLRNRRGR